MQWVDLVLATGIVDTLKAPRRSLEVDHDQRIGILELWIAAIRWTNPFDRDLISIDVRDLGIPHRDLDRDEGSDVNRGIEPENPLGHRIPIAPRADECLVCRWPIDEMEPLGKSSNHFLAEYATDHDRHLFESLRTDLFVDVFERVVHAHQRIKLFLRHAVHAGR